MIAGGEYERDPETEEELLNAISDILGRRRKEMVTRVVLVAETMDEEGRKGMWTCATPGLATWDERALLDYALTKVHNTELLGLLINWYENER